MERVNERFPLEGNTWGFEDYAVSLGGYEAQHYCEIGEAFEKDDEVLIKPLQFVEKRARTITGRDQISEDGRHLIDGVPFGRPLLKRPKRPDIVIPPRKRQKVEGGGLDSALVRFEEVNVDEEDDDEDDEDDGDFEEEEGALDDRLAAEDAGFAYREDGEEEDADGDSEEDDDEDDADFGTDEAAATSQEDSEDSSEEDSDSDSDNDDDSSSDDSSSDDSHEPGPLFSSTHNKPGSTVGGASSKLAAVATSSVSEGPASLPYEGARRTKARNARRRDAKRLKLLKDAGTLHLDADLSDLATWLKTNSMPSMKAIEAAASAEKLEHKRQQLLADIAGGGIDVTSADDQLSVDLATAAEEKPFTREESSDDEGPEELPIGTEPANKVEAEPIPVQETSKITEGHGEPTPAFQRARINLAGANRLVFGSLGLRTPKTQAEKDALQKKLAARPKKAGPVSEPVPVETPVEEDEDPEAWREKVVISAVECVDEGVVLSAPPFPFEQRWDPQYRNNNKKRNRNNALYNAAKRQKKRNNNGSDFVETYDKYNQDGGGDALNYDDEEEEFEDFGDDEYWEDGALLDGDEDEEESDDFPPLPEDPSSLASLAEADAAVGDFIVFTEMMCSAATSWQPQMLSQRAKLESRDESEGSWKIALPRQIKAKEYDEDGNRVYEKFEMEGFDDEEDEESWKIVPWSSMMDVKLLQRGEEKAEET
jgi:hypothetical protein